MESTETNRLTTVNKLRVLRETEHGPPQQQLDTVQDLRLSESPKISNVKTYEPKSGQSDDPLLRNSTSLYQYSSTTELARNKDEEIIQLRHEMTQLLGKIKGYQTLGHLYQEAKHESMNYKQKNEELAIKLETLMKLISPEKDLSLHELQHPSHIPEPDIYSKLPEKENEGVGSTSTKDLAEGTIRESDNPRNLDVVSCKDKSWQMVDEKSRYSNKSHEVVENYDGKSEHKPAAKTPSSSASSPSFVRITGSDLSSIDRNVESDDELTQREAFVDSSSSIQADLRVLTEQLQDSSISQDSQVMASDLIHFGNKMLKKYKQVTVLQILLDEQRQESDEKEMQLIQLQKINDDLRHKVQELERQCRRSGDNPGSDSSIHGSMEWVDVQKNRATELDTQDELVTILTGNEMQLRNENDKLKSTIYDLEVVNQNLKDGLQHCESTYRSRMSTLEGELMQERRRFEDYQENDSKRQQEFDEIMLTSKKQREELENEKEDALQQLHMERRKRMELEECCLKAEECKARMESRLQDIQRSLACHPIPATTPFMSHSSFDVSSEIEILKQQITIYKEDFDNERKDREKAQSLVNQLKLESEQQKLNNDSLRRQLNKVKDDLVFAKSENSDLKTRFTQTLDQLKAIQKQVRPTHQRQIPINLPGTLYTWSCWKCTYANPFQRSSCEMCGAQKAHSGVRHPSSDLVQYAEPDLAYRFPDQECRRNPEDERNRQLTPK